MCSGQYDKDEQVEWTKYADPAEITWDALFKATSILSVACVILR